MGWEGGGNVRMAQGMSKVVQEKYILDLKEMKVEGGWDQNDWNYIR